MIEIRISGYGGQGVILSGMVIGKAAALYEDKFSSLAQAFGPEARGSSCSAQVIVSDTKILYPYLVNSDILVSMSQEAFRKFSPELKKTSGILVYENELVKPEGLSSSVKTFGIPATRIAEEKLGKNIFLNIVMVGFFTAVTDIIKEDNAKRSVSSLVPPHTVEQNLKAFDLGYSYGKENFA
ncbi:MAG: 2-oxoacid:acceptor oxidoreductase family protein [Pseudomonadota bacterium]